MNKIGIYVHIPFCKQKCLYCDFISYSNKLNCVEKYIERLKKEIDDVSSKIDVNSNIVNTIYIGGGTPSYINEKYISEILEKIKTKFIIEENVEVTIEVNPGTANKEKLEYYKKIGVNRLSIGLQSTNDSILKLLGRIHNYEEFTNVYYEARNAGFKNINIDLIIGVPTQTIEDVKDSISKILNLNPEHISVYSLIVEENTPLEEKISKGELVLPEEELEREMYWYTKNELQNNGYKHYEISNFSKVGKESKHNVNCWNQEKYLGFGVAAHSYFDNQRYSNTDSLEEYINEEEIYRIRTINEIQTLEDKEKEYMLLGLRKIEGINISEFKRKFIDNPIYLYRNEIDKLVKEELIEVDLDYIKLTKKGIDLANLVWEEFV